MPLGDARAGELLRDVRRDRRGDCWWLVLRDCEPVRGDGAGGIALLSPMRARYRKPLGRFVPEGHALLRYP